MKPQEREAIFRRWTADHTAMIARAVRGFAADSTDRDDLQQEMLLALWKAIPAFRHESKASTYIYRVLHNTALTWFRRSRKAHAEPMVAPDELMDTRTDANRLLGLIHDHIHALGAVDRSLMLLSLEGLSYAEIADVHGIQPNHVGVRLHRLRQQLLDNLRVQIDD